MKKRGGRSNQVRIIGGEHRGRRLSFPNTPGLRPTGDRIRETLFNWLQPRLPGSSCLDLFAGSGALGLEAASRGAGRVLMIDSSPAVVEQLQQNISLLRLEQSEVLQADALTWLEREPQPFDILFLDPPFAANLLQELCQKLEQGSWLRPDAWIYLEMDAGMDRPLLPANWHIMKEKRAGQVEYLLCSRS